MTPLGAVRAEAAALRALGPLDLPGLVRGAGEVDGVGVATAHVAGRSLAELGPMPWPAVASVLAPVADALAAIHAAGWVHGDVSTANVVVADVDGRGVLVDLGCAAPFALARPTGTPGFVAPEVAAGAPVTPAAEVWSLAAVAAAAAPTPTPPDAALALRRALASEPSARPTATELAALLHLAGVGAPRIAAEPAPADPGDPRAATTRDFGPRPPAPLAAPPAPARRAVPLAVAAVVLVALAAMWWVTQPSPAPAAPRCATAPGAAALVGDVDGDGCDERATWSAGVLVVGTMRIAVGAPGDDVALGDWDCDGVDTPAAYRPSTGTLTIWDRWPDDTNAVAPASTTLHAPAGHLAVERGICDRAFVRGDR